MLLFWRGVCRLTARDHIGLNVLAQNHQVALGFGLGHATVWGEDPGKTMSHECCQKTREQSLRCARWNYSSIKGTPANYMVSASLWMISTLDSAVDVTQPCGAAWAAVWKQKRINVVYLERKKQRAHSCLHFFWLTVESYVVTRKTGWENSGGAFLEVFFFLTSEKIKQKRLFWGCVEAVWLYWLEDQSNGASILIHFKTHLFCYTNACCPYYLPTQI